MKRKLPLSFNSHTRVLGLCLTIGWFVCLPTSAHAQSLTNWTVGYLHGGPDDFDVKDTTRLILRPVGTIRVAHAYFSQTVTNLDTNHLYTLSGHMSEGWWRGDQTGGGGTGYNPGDSTGEGGDGKRTKFLVYMEAIGGLGAPTPDGRASLILTNPTPVYAGYPDLIYYATDNANHTYSVKQKPDASGKIEVRLHYDKVNQVIYDKCWIMHGDFGLISVTP